MRVRAVMDMFAKHTRGLQRVIDEVLGRFGTDWEEHAYQRQRSGLAGGFLRSVRKFRAGRLLLVAQLQDVIAAGRADGLGDVAYAHRLQALLDLGGKLSV